VEALFGVPQRADYHPEIDTGVHVMMVVDMAARLGLALPARFAALTHDLGKALTPVETLPRHIGHETAGLPLLDALCERLRTPVECRDVARLAARFHGDMHKVDELRPATVLKILERCDALRRPERFELVIGACEADFRGRGGQQEKPYPQAGRWREALAIVQSVDAGAISRNCTDRAMIPARIHEARVAAIEALDHRGRGTQC
jgi:tRNA nucleotidyltransferase (CCA-adding enzyme)